MVGGGVRPGPPFAQHPGQRFAGVVQEAEQRVVAERAFPRRCRRLLLRVADHDRGVQIQHQSWHRLPGRGRLRQRAAGVGQLRPRHLPRRRTGQPQPVQHRTVHHGQQPPRGRIRRHRPEQGGLVAQHGQIRDRLTAVGEHHRHIDGDPARIMPTTPLPQPGQRIAERARQAGHLGHIGQQSGTRVADHTPPVSTDDDLRTRRGSLHLGSAFRDGWIGPRQVPSFQIRRHLSLSIHYVGSP